MKLSHKEVELLYKVLKKVIKINYELDRVDKEVIDLCKRLEVWHETTLQLERE